MVPRSPAANAVRRRSSGRRTRAEIVAAAEGHFAERGFEAVRLEDIATEVGIRRATIFYHFGDKREIHAAVLLLVARIMLGIESPEPRLEDRARRGTP